MTVTVYAVLGDGYAPEAKEEVVTRKGKREVTEPAVQVWRAKNEESAIRQVQVRYIDPNPIRGEGTFWKPLDWFEPGPDTGPVKALFPPWVVLYIVVYVPAMFATKTLLRVA